MNNSYSLKNEIEFIKNGDQFYQSLIDLINSAKKCIFIHMYIFTYDEDSIPLVNILKEKSEQGVDIYFIIDGFGSRDFPLNIIEELRGHNIKIDFFSPVTAMKLKSIGRRLHQKVILIDADIALIGGTNISQEYIHPKGSTPWLDYACTIRGEEILRLQSKLKRIYKKVFKNDKSSIDMLLELPVAIPTKITRAKIIENDYTRLKREIQHTYHKEIKNAQKSIVITATYFLPGRKLLNLLKKASKRGVRVELIFGKYSDIPSYNNGSMYFFPWYLKNNIKIYQWNKAIIHGKIALIDDQICNIGSYNHNVISQYANLEMNIEVKDKIFANIVKQEIELIKSQSELIDLKEYEKTSFLNRLKYFCFNISFNTVIPHSKKVI